MSETLGWSTPLLPPRGSMRAEIEFLDTTGLSLVDDRVRLTAGLLGQGQCISSGASPTRTSDTEN